MHLPAQPSIQIVPLTRGSVIVAGAEAYACTNTADILATIAVLLPQDGTLPYAPPDDFLRSMGRPVPEVVPPMAPESPVPPAPTAPPDNNPMYQRDNLLKLCDAWAQDRITDEQFDEYLVQACPDIPLEEAYLTRDSFAPGQTNSQIQDMLHTEAPGGPA